MRYKEIPVLYSAECSEFCEGFAEFGELYDGITKEEAIEKWNNNVKA